MANKHFYVKLCISLIVVHSLGQDPVIKGTLTMDTPQRLSLLPGQPFAMTISLPQTRPSEFDLYLKAAPINSDPFQVPLLTLTGADYTRQCFSADAEFAGVCRVRSSELVGRAPTVVLRCMVECELEVEGYLSQEVRLAAGKALDLSGKKGDLEEIVHVQAPKGENTLALMAVILNPEQSVIQGEEGVDVLVNLGAQKQDPSQADFQMKGGSLNGGGKGIFLYKVAEGTLIRCLIKVKQGVNIRFSVSPLKGNEFGITLGHAYYDFALSNQSKQYDLDLHGLIDDKQTLELVFDIYSGRPEFQLSFFASFTSLIDFPQTSSANSILISPQIRKRLSFNGTLYIRVKTAQKAEYYFYTQLVRQDVAYLQPYLTYFDEVETKKVSNYILFQRYRFDLKPQPSLFKNYSFKVEIERGKGSFHFKRCPSLQKAPSDNPTLGDCLYSSAEQIKSDQFYSQQIQNRQIQSGNMMTIYMVYDVSKCTATQIGESNWNVLCAFHIMAVGQSTDQPFSFSLLPQRKYLTNYLRQGKIVKEYIPKDNYAYFALSLSDIDSVEQVNIFLTALSGQAALIVSTTDQLPSFSSIGTYQAGSKCNIVLEKQKLSKEIYIAVYAYRFTEVNLGAIVHRKADNVSVHDIPLQEGNLHTYLLNTTQKNAQFIVSVKEQQDITILINEVSGHVTVTVLDKNNQVVSCKEPKDRLSCQFSPQRYSNYTVRVEGEKGSPQSKFSISYKSQKNTCFSSSLNHPIYVSLAGLQYVCHSFPLNRQIDLSLAISFTHLQTMDKQITTEILFNDQLFKTINKTHSTITVTDMINVCPMGTLLNGFPKTCKISIRFKNNIDKDNHFSFVLEQEDAEIALFDGVNERVRGKSAEVGKYFYYHVGSIRPIQIFFSTQTLKSHYFLTSQFVSNDDFLLRATPTGKVIFLPYLNPNERPQQRIDDRLNEYTALLGMTGLQTVSIGSDAIKQYCPNSDCYLTISVYREEYENSIETDEDFYELEVTQQETVLYLGQTKVGTVDRGQIYTYLINPEDAVVQFKLLDESKNGVCFFAEAALSNGTVIRKNELSLDLQVIKSQGVERVYVKGKKDSCSFSISYLSNEVPYRIVKLSQPYELDLKSKQSARFIYYHQNPRSFKLANLASAGESKAYILPIKNTTFTLTNLPKINFKTYPFVTSFDGEFSMLQTDQNFCSKCYYYIYVTTDSKFVGQVVVLRMYDPVPLSTNHMFKEHLVPLTPLGVENYIYYALASFNLTINMLAGKISVTVVDPEGSAVVSQQLISTKEFELKAIDYRQKEKIQFYSERTKYRIRIASITQAQFYLQVSREYLTQRIFEGLPANILLDGTQTQTVQFINSQDLNKPLNLMIDLQEEEGKEAILSFQIKGIKKDGGSLPTAQLFKKTTKSDNTYIVDLANFQGRYFINIHSNIKVNSTFILVKNSLTHISPKQNYLFNTPAVYQVFSDYKKVLIEVFNCQGEPTLLGSKDERDMEDSFKGESPIAIKRPNYAGHYVYSIQKESSSYFIRLGNKQPSQTLEYLINYYYYQSINPYEAIDVTSYHISAAFTQDGNLKLNFTAPVLLDYKQQNPAITVDISIFDTTYNAYVSANLQDLKRRSRCNILGLVAQKKNQIKPDVVIEKKILEDVKLSEESTLYVTVQASIKIKVIKQGDTEVQNSPQVLTLFYNTVQLTGGVTKIILTSRTYWFTDSFLIFVGWMLLPFILAAVLLYYLLRFCMGKFMRYQNNMVEQVEIVPSNQTVPTEQKIVDAAESAQIPNTGTAMIKQSI